MVKRKTRTLRLILNKQEKKKTIVQEKREKAKKETIMPILKERNLVNQKKKNVLVIWSKHFCTIFSLIFTPIGEIEF